MTRGTLGYFASALVVGALIGGVAGWQLHPGAVPATPAIQHADSAAAAHAPGLAHIDTVYRHDTVTAARWFTRYDSSRQVDTVVRDSIVYVRADVADSTVRSCRTLFQSCRARGDSLAALVGAQRVQITTRDQALAAARPSRLRRVLEDVGAAAAGYGACRAGVRVPFPSVKLPP